MFHHTPYTTTNVLVRSFFFAQICALVCLAGSTGAYTKVVRIFFPRTILAVPKLGAVQRPNADMGCSGTIAQVRGGDGQAPSGTIFLPRLRFFYGMLREVFFLVVRLTGVLVERWCME